MTTQTETTTGIRAIAASRNVHRVILIAGYAVAVVLIFVGAWAGRFNLDNVDGISYISIARQYADGSFGTAINAYWSPMISWLASLAVRAGMSGQAAIVLLNALAAAGGLALGGWFIWGRTGRRFVPTAVFLMVMGIFFAGNVDLLTPDMMVVTWIIGFGIVVIRMDDRLPESTRRQQILAGVLLGALCALGYFIKLFLVPVFFVALGAWWLLRRIRARREEIGVRDLTVVRAWSVTLGVAALALVVIAAPWVATISAKYGTFTVGSSFAVNLESKFEPGAINDTGTPVVVNYDIDTPPNDRAISFGEDRTAQAGAGDAGTQDPLGARISYYIGQRLDAFPAYINKIGTIAPFAVPAMCAVAIGFIGGFLTFRRNKDVLALSFIWGVYFLGYAAITSLASGGGNGRYYWPMLALGTLSACLLLPWLWERVRGTGWWRRALVVVIIVLLPLSAIWGHGLGRSGPFTQGPPPSGYLTLLANAGPSLEQKLVDEHLVEDIPSDSRIMGSNYRRALKFAFFLDRVQIYGRAEQGYQISDPKFQEALRTYEIDYYLQFTPTGLTPPDSSGAGTIVDQFEYFGACADDATAIDEQCLVQVIQVTR